MTKEIQPSLFSARQTRRLWIERLVVTGCSRPDKVKNFLKVLESHSREGGPWSMYRHEIAQEMGVSEKTVTRAIADCERLGFVIVRFRSFAAHVASQYEIDWCVVAQAILDCPMTTDIIDRNPRNSTRDTVSATRDTVSATRDTVSATRDTVSRVNAGDTSLTRARSYHVLNHELTMFKPSCENDGFEKSFEKKKPSNGVGGWPFKILKDHLRDKNTIQRLFEHALTKGWKLQLDHRTRFFTLAKHCAEGPFDSPGGKFSAQLRQCLESGANWPGTNDQELWAIAAIQELDRPKRTATSDLSESEDFDVRKKQAIADLMKRYPETSKR